MRKKIISSIGIVLFFTIMVLNVRMIVTSSVMSLGLHELKSQACEVFPEEWGPVILMQFGICDITGGGIGVYGCYDANADIC